MRTSLFKVPNVVEVFFQAALCMTPNVDMYLSALSDLRVDGYSSKHAKRRQDALSKVETYMNAGRELSKQFGLNYMDVVCEDELVEVGNEETLPFLRNTLLRFALFMCRTSTGAPRLVHEMAPDEVVLVSSLEPSMNVHLHDSVSHYKRTISRCTPFMFLSKDVPVQNTTGDPVCPACEPEIYVRRQKRKSASKGGVHKRNKNGWCFVGGDKSPGKLLTKTSTLFNFDVEDSWFNDGTYQKNELKMMDIILHELAHMVGISHDFARRFDGSEEHINSLQGEIDEFIRERPEMETNDDGSRCTPPYTKKRCSALWASFADRGSQIRGTPAGCVLHGLGPGSLFFSPKSFDAIWSVTICCPDSQCSTLGSRGKLCSEIKWSLVPYAITQFLLGVAPPEILGAMKSYRLMSSDAITAISIRIRRRDQRGFCSASDPYAERVR
jgi:hypothetical protein